MCHCKLQTVKGTPGTLITVRYAYNKYKKQSQAVGYRTTGFSKGTKGTPLISVVFDTVLPV